jgi:hypothetical protein
MPDLVPRTAAPAGNRPLAAQSAKASHTVALEMLDSPQRRVWPGVQVGFARWKTELHPSPVANLVG